MLKIKVLHIITRLDKGGSARNTLLTALCLDKDKYEVSLMSGYPNDPDGEIADLIAKNNIDYIVIPQLVREISLFRDIRAFLLIFAYIKKRKFDIVHTHTSKAGMLGRWAAKLAGAKIIIHTPHGHIFYGYFGWLKTRLFIFLERLTALITDKIITLTQKGKEEHVKYGIAKPDKFVPIYSGIELGKFTDFKVDKINEKQNFGIPLDGPVIGTVTRLEPVKGNAYLLHSLLEVTKLFPTLKVIIVGDGSEREYLESYVKNFGLSSNVMFLGISSDIVKVVSMFDIFVLPSLNEGMGRCLLEAQAIGIPVIATAVGGVPEVVKDGVTGILVPARDSHAIAEAIIKLLKDKTLRESMSAEARQWVSNRFSAEAMVNKISELYAELTPA